VHECPDVLGVGFGPANVALAVAFEEMGSPLRVRFLERQREPRWQGGMLLDRSNVQNHPCRDLVTLRNPRSRYTFLNYLFEMGRLVEHLNLPMEFPLRKEYAQYVSWVTHHFDHLVDYGQPATEVSVTTHDGHPAYEVETETGQRHRGRSLVLAVGRTPHIPPEFDGLLGPRVFHLTEYLYRLPPESPDTVVVVGGSQSAVEIALDLSARYPETRVVLLMRGFGPRLKDTSPFSEEGYFPRFTSYYFDASRASKRILDGNLRNSNYSSVDRDVLDELYLLRYEQRLDGRQRMFVHGNREVRAAQVTEAGVRLTIEEVHTGTTEELTADFVVLATGFLDIGSGPGKEPFPPLLSGVIDRFRFDDGQLTVNADYRLEPTTPGTPPLFLNGLCESTHGIGDAGSFSLLSLRAAVILEGLGKVISRARR
jgi:L-ornithine N5-monooxygenase